MFFSVINNSDEIIDCRKLQMEIEAFDIDIFQVKQMAESIYRESRSLLAENLLSEWHFDEKNSSKKVKESSIPMLINNAEDWISFSCDSYVADDADKIKRTFKAYDNFYQASVERESLKSTMSADYIDFFSGKFANINDSDAVRTAVLQLFNETGKVYLNTWHGPDISMNFSSLPFHNNKERYRAEFRISFNISCIGGYIISLSEKMAEIAVKIASGVPNVSARIGLTPAFAVERMSGHMKYFGNYCNDGRQRDNGLWDIEWYPFAYSCGVEWFNILSPLQRSNVPSVLEDAEQYDECDVYEIEGGGIVVRSKKDVLNTDIPELASMKSLMYDALYPGMREYKLNHLDFGSFCELIKSFKPRSCWERIPIFDDEIEVLEDRIIFKHRNNIKVKNKYDDIDEWW